MQKDLTVNGGASPLFNPPHNTQNAQERFLLLQNEITQLERSLCDKHVKNPQTGLRFSTEEYFQWKKKANAALAQKTRELSYLKAWAKTNGRSLTPQPVKAETTFKMLWRCGQLFLRLSEQGVPFTAEERQLIADIEAYTGLHADQVLEEARVCMSGSPENFFKLGGDIARVTKDGRDLAILTQEWEKMSAQTPRNEGRMTNCAETYAQALMCFGRTEEATIVVRSLDQFEGAAAYAWSIIAERSGDQAALEHARVLGRRLEPARREWFFLRLYSLFGQQEDTELLLGNPELERLMGRKMGWFKALVIKEYASWGRVQEAREIFQGISDAEDRLHALAYIVKEGQDKEEMRNLLSMLKRYTPKKLMTLKLVAAVLARCGHGEHVRKILDSLPTWHLRCAGYAVLARFMPDNADALLDQAEQMLLTPHMSGVMEESQALYSVVYAQIVTGRKAKAIRTVRIIKEKEVRCAALLLLYSALRKESAPAFLVEML